MYSRREKEHNNNNNNKNTLVWSHKRKDASSLVSPVTNITIPLAAIVLATNNPNFLSTC